MQDCKHCLQAVLHSAHAGMPNKHTARKSCRQLVALASSAALIKLQEPLACQHTMHLQHLVNAHVYIEATHQVSLEQPNSACSSPSINKLNFCRRVLFPWTCTQGPAHSPKLQCCLNAYLLGHHTKELVTYCGCAACSLTSCPNVCMQMLLGPLPWDAAISSPR